MIQALGILKRLGVVVGIITYYALCMRVASVMAVTVWDPNGIPKQEIAWYEAPVMSPTLWGYSIVIGLLMAVLTVLLGGLIGYGIFNLVRWIFTPSYEDRARARARALAKEEAKRAKQKELEEATKKALLADNNEPLEIPVEEQASPDGQYQQPPRMTPRVS